METTMKIITFPTLDDINIDINLIDPYKRGLVIAYKQSKPVSYLMYDEEASAWYLFNNMDYQDFSVLKENLLESCKDLLNQDLADCFKFIDFK